MKEPAPEGELWNGYLSRVNISSDRFRQIILPITALGELPQLSQWQGLQTLGIVVRSHQLWNWITNQVQLYLSSLPPDAQLLANAVRSHWQIENTLFLDS